MFSSLLKAAVGVVVETPVALVKDVITLGGAIDNKSQPHTFDALGKVVKNIENITDPRK